MLADSKNAQYEDAHPPTMIPRKGTYACSRRTSNEESHHISRIQLVSGLTFSSKHDILIGNMHRKPHLSLKGKLQIRYIKKTEKINSSVYLLN